MYNKIIKRLLDIIVGLIGSIGFAVLSVFVAPAIYMTDKGPVFYNADRIGKDGKLFKMYKFRSMYMNAPDIRNSDGSTYNGEDDPRVTKIGKLIRKTSIDEIPQFLNVLKGDMSLIGPRPDPADFLNIYTEEQRKKLSVRPGITGYSQAYFRNSIPLEEKFANDVKYAEHVSFGFDVKIFFKTVVSVFKKENIFSEVAVTDARRENAEFAVK